MSVCGCGCGQAAKDGRKYVDDNHKARANYARRRNERRTYQRKWWHERRKLAQVEAIHADTQCDSCFFLTACRRQCERVNAVSVYDDVDMETRLFRLPCFLE